MYSFPTYGATNLIDAVVTELGTGVKSTSSVLFQTARRAWYATADTGTILQGDFDDDTVRNTFYNTASASILFDYTMNAVADGNDNRGTRMVSDCSSTVQHFIEVAAPGHFADLISLMPMRYEDPKRLLAEDFHAAFSYYAVRPSAYWEATYNLAEVVPGDIMSYRANANMSGTGHVGVVYSVTATANDLWEASSGIIYQIKLYHAISDPGDALGDAVGYRLSTRYAEYDNVRKAITSFSESSDGSDPTRVVGAVFGHAKGNILLR